ncbi:multiubiquitin domain-containing protein [Methylocapsa acidiphila]|uniref:multiubiquitin domain-containing protein n=1 Tax=Methylocapsa acidiphila TaxID=133552 RepID=UPI0004220746|nr:multiubiquitin domain-containing protein [Methylocapsa acidiphila]
MSIIEIADEAPAKPGDHEIDVANDRFETRTLTLEPAHATGQGLIQALGYEPAEAYIVLRYRPDGFLEEIGLEEPIDLTEPRGNSFFVNEASEMANLAIGGVRLTWTQSVVTGWTVRHLARQADSDLEVVLERENEAPVVIGDEDEVRLSRPGLERFHLRPPTEVTIEVNGQPVKIRRGRRTGGEIKAAAIDQGVKIQASFTLSADLPGDSKLIGDTDHVRIKGGEKFLAIDDHDDS